MDRDALERARVRIAAARADEPDAVSLAAALDAARGAVDELAGRAAELEASVPDRLGAALRDGMRTEVAPVAQNLAEVRGLSGQTIRRLERIQGDIDAERRARIEDLALVVELISSGWRAVERRLDRLERSLDRLERNLEAAPRAELYRLDGGQTT